MPSRSRWAVVFCVGMTLLTAVLPVGRLLRRTELSYNEGWNVAGAMRLSAGAAANAQLPVTTGAGPLDGGCCQTALYPAAWGWTTVNYPVLSFAMLAELHRVTGEYLVTARCVSLLSLVLCAVLLAAIARALGATRRATVLTGLLCFATFAVCAVDSVGVDDPQLLGDALFLVALWVYLRGRREGDPVPGVGTTAVVAALFVLAGCVKQSPVDFPLAVLLDLSLLSRRRAAWFAACGIGFGVLAGMLNQRVGGPWFVQELLLGRLYAVAKAWEVGVAVLGPMLVPVLLAAAMALHVRRDAKRRIVALLLVTSIAVGGYFGGGSGVAGNALFTALFATVLLVGLLFSAAEQRLGGERAVPWPKRWWSAEILLPIIAFAWLLVPALVQGVANPWASLQATAAAEQRFLRAEALLRQHPGPALCESMLLCLEVGKPYLFDPFNATRLMLQGRLSEAALIAEIEGHRYGAIQLHAPVPGGAEPDDLMRERFSEPVLRAIDRSYALQVQTADGAIYLPRMRAADAAASR